ncbi:MAG: hypothetical protein KTQ49_05975 [Candidatus Omnitrophica bacterium]|nr:hypothetical protein [Candidatus Omnitrophota bacterium]
MRKRILIFILVSGLAVVHSGAIRRSDDPIRNAQTDGISFQQKMEEEKDGVKGPSSYSVRYNPNDTFFIDPPFDKEEDTAAGVERVVREPSGLSDWWEEQPAQESPAASGERPLEVMGVAHEGASSEDGNEVIEDVPAPSDAGANDDYWW